MKLSPAETKLFYKLRDSWLIFANRELQILPTDIPVDRLRTQPIEAVAELSDVAADRTDLLEQYLELNPDQLPPDALSIITAWRHRIKGQFYILKHLKAYSVLMSTEKPIHLYAVLGLYDSIEDLIGKATLPVLVRTVLLPFRDRITYDGFLRVTNVTFGPGIRSNLNETYRHLKAHQGIVESLIGPDGQPLLRTSLSRKVSKPLPDWRPVLAEIVAQTQKLRETETELQAAAFSLLRAAASLAQSTLEKENAENEVIQRMRAVRRAMTKLERSLSKIELDW